MVEPFLHDPQPFEQKYFRHVAGFLPLGAERVKANAGERIGDEVDVTELRHPDPQIPILAEEQRFIETAGCAHEIAPREHG